MKIEQVAVQLYTLRDLTANDMTGTLRQVAEIGYRAVELAGYGNSSAHEIRALLDTLGVRVAATHISIDQLEQQPDAALDDLGVLGCEYAVVPWISEEYRTSIDQARALAERLNQTGRRLHEHGRRLAYHNHQFEFAPLDGTTMWETLVAETDPALVDFELDVYWVVEGGFDPVELLQRHGGRVRLLHVKDRSLAPGGTFAPVGDGSLAWPQILEAAPQASWYIVEQDVSDDPLRDIRRSFQHLQTLA